MKEVKDIIVKIEERITLLIEKATGIDERDPSLRTLMKNFHVPMFNHLVTLEIRKKIEILNKLAEEIDSLFSKSLNFRSSSKLMTQRELQSRFLALRLFHDFFVSDFNYVEQEKARFEDFAHIMNLIEENQRFFENVFGKEQEWEKEFKEIKKEMEAEIHSEKTALNIV